MGDQRLAVGGVGGAGQGAGRTWPLVTMLWGYGRKTTRGGRQEGTEAAAEAAGEGRGGFVSCPGQVVGEEKGPGTESCQDRDRR